MSNKYVEFVSDEIFLNCVREVCESYPSGLEVDLKKLQKNTLDPFKQIFDIMNGRINVDQWIKNEQIRQSDKTINNRIGDFHQKLLGSVDGWHDLGRGHPLGIDLVNDKKSIFIELKNKHNTVKGEDHKNVFDKLAAVLKTYPKAKVYYAYILPKKPSSGEKVWCPSRRNPNPQILECWGKRVYEIVTGDSEALSKMWVALPKAINKIIGDTYDLNKESKKLKNFFDSAIQ